MAYAYKYLSAIVLGKRNKSLGEENPDKQFYIIGFEGRSNGLFALMRPVIANLMYAEHKGYTPIIDFENFKTQYVSEEESNSWNIFFEQPCGYGMMDITKSKNIVFTVGRTPSWKYFCPNSYDIDNSIRKKFDKYASDIFSKYIKPNKKLKEIVAEGNRILPEGKRVLGILARGTDYTLKKPSGHPIQPAVNDIIIKAQEVIETYNCDYVYLATEDADIYEIFNEQFKDKLITVDAKRYSKSDLERVGKLHEIKEPKVLGGMKYYASIHNLSLCDCFIGGNTAGTEAVFWMSEGFEYSYVWDLGLYD